MGPSIRDRASTLIERMSPRARQWATIGAISAVAVGVLWTVFAMGSGDSPQRSAVAAGAGDLKPTNVDLMAPGAIITSSIPIWMDTQDGNQDGFTGLLGTSMAAAEARRWVQSITSAPLRWAGRAAAATPEAPAAPRRRRRRRRRRRPVAAPEPTA